MADLRRCIGSTRFGIEAHDAPITDFPSQPSHKDGLGRMCKPHWNQYTAGLARDAKARQAVADGASAGGATVPAADITNPEEGEGPAPKRTRRGTTSTLIADGQGDAG
jgi:hypothetical protein